MRFKEEYNNQISPEYKQKTNSKLLTPVGYRSVQLKDQKVMDNQNQ